MASETESTTLDSFFSSHREKLIYFFRAFLKKSPESVPILLPPLYWVVCSLKILKYNLSSQERNSIVSSLSRLYNISDAGGFSCSFISSVPTPLATFAAIQLHVLLDLPLPENFRLPDFHSMVDGLADGAREDLRFLFSRVACLRLLHRLQNDFDSSFARACFNSEFQGFSFFPHSEIHLGATFCGLATLALTGSTLSQEFSYEDLFSYIHTRLAKLNGRPEKLPDVCYVWWGLGALALLADARSESPNEVLKAAFKECDLSEFVMSCFDEDSGGFARRPREGADLFHSFAAVLIYALAKDELDVATVLPKAALRRWDDVHGKSSP